MPNIILPTLTCLRCGHQWVPRKPVVWVCAKCHSPRWAEQGGRPKKEKP